MRSKRLTWRGEGLIRGLPALALALSVAGPGCAADDGRGSATALDAPLNAGAGQRPGNAESGDPIRVGTFTSPSNLPVLSAGARTAIWAINAAGGVHGRPLELVTCDNENDTNKAAECARRFATDATIMATVGVISVFGGDTNPILERAGVAGIGTATAGSGDLRSPIVFPTTMSSQAFLGTSAILHDQLEATRQGLVMIDSPAAVALKDTVNRFILEPRGTRLAATAVIPLTAADIALQAAALARTDAQAVALTPDLAIRYVRAARQQGYERPIIASASQLSAADIAETLRGADEELYVVATYDYGSAGWARMLREADAAGVDPAAINDTFATGWLSVQLFAEVARSVTAINRAAVLKGIRTLSSFDTEGMTAPLDFTVEGEAFGGEAPRLLPSIQFIYGYRYRGGAFEALAGNPLPLFLER